MATRVYGPGITDPPSSDLVKVLLAAETFWFKGMCSVIEGMRKRMRSYPLSDGNYSCVGTVSLDFPNQRYPKECEGETDCLWCFVMTERAVQKYCFSHNIYLGGLRVEHFRSGRTGHGGQLNLLGHAQKRSCLKVPSRWVDVLVQACAPTTSVSHAFNMLLNGGFDYITDPCRILGVQSVWSAD